MCQYNLNDRQDVWQQIVEIIIEWIKRKNSKRGLFQGVYPFPQAIKAKKHLLSGITKADNHFAVIDINDSGLDIKQQQNEKNKKKK